MLGQLAAFPVPPRCASLCTSDHSSWCCSYRGGEQQLEADPQQQAGKREHTAGAYSSKAGHAQRSELAMVTSLSAEVVPGRLCTEQGRTVVLNLQQQHKYSISTRATVLQHNRHGPRSTYCSQPAIKQT